MKSTLKSKNPEFILRHIKMSDAEGYFEAHQKIADHVGDIWGEDVKE